MAAWMKINVILRSGRQARFEGITPTKAYSAEKDGVKVEIASGNPAAATVTPPPGELLKSVEYNLFTDSRNYHKVIHPDTGRRWMQGTSLSSFPYFEFDSAVCDFRMPLWMFTGQGLNTQLAFGIIGLGYETYFRALEPTHNRALIAYFRRHSVQIKRGTDLYPIPDSIAKARDDGTVTEHIFFKDFPSDSGEPWVLTLRDFSEHMKRLYGIPDVGNLASMQPLWCSWTDWMSDDVTDQVIMDNVRQGVPLGIKNYIIDDGWFGPGLDTDISVPLNIGDWEVDPSKIRDMPKLVADIRKAGGVPIIWCAPHAVAKGAKCFDERKKYLIIKDDGGLLTTPNQFHCLCFMSPQARQIMADVCCKLIDDFDFDGAKYDLFNVVPNMKCCNGEHEHDVTSMMEGLHKTLELIYQRTVALKPDYIIELKQNYATPFLSQFGTMTRAGDTPYSPQVNYERTIFNQAYTPYAINDYQTITGEDDPVAAAIVCIKMIAAGIPTYSIDFNRLTQANKNVIGHYNNWYCRHIPTFMKYRLPLNGENNCVTSEGDDQDIFFLLNDVHSVELTRSATVCNGTYRNELLAKFDGEQKATVICFDPQGNKAWSKVVTLTGWTPLDMLPGGRLEISF